jgi:hypothetical protein
VSQQVINKSLPLLTLFIVTIIIIIIIIVLVLCLETSKISKLRSAVSRIQGNSAVLRRNLSLNSGNDISPVEGFAVSEFAAGTFDKAAVDDLSAVSRKKRGCAGMVRLA